MSPIGRVFIVLNLFLASGFVFVSGQLLQNQNNYKQQLADTKEEMSTEISKRDNQIDELEKARGNAEAAKMQFQTQFQNAEVSIQGLKDENLRLENLTSSQEAHLKQLSALAEAQNTDIKAAMEQAREAYAASIKAGEVRDEAVRAKDAAEAENRNLKNEVASLNSTIENKNVVLADLEKDNSEKDLLISAAKANGFLTSMAAPALAGTVTMASDRLVTISVADNPGNIDIQDHINKNPFRIAIYDDNGYKAEAVATRYEPSANAILCNVMFKKDNAVIRTGDKASTRP